MRVIVLLLLVTTSACSGVRTNDVMMDDMVRRESGVVSRPSCIRVYKRTNVFRPVSNGPPALFEARKIHDPDARRAAAMIAIKWNAAADQSSTVIGKDTQGRCSMSISRPVRSGNFAFVHFAGPSAKIGAYVYYRSGDRWHYLEEVTLGFW